MTVLLGLVLGALVVAPGWANDEADERIPCKLGLVRRRVDSNGFGARAKLVCVSPSSAMLFDMPDEPANDPMIEGATLRLFDTGGMAGDDTYNLPATGWTRSPSNTAHPAQTLIYTGARTPTDPCKYVLLKPRILKALCVRSGMTLQPPFSGDLAVTLTVGTNSKRYCARFGGITVRNNALRFRHTDAPAPGACTSPSGAFLETSASAIE